MARICWLDDEPDQIQMVLTQIRALGFDVDHHASFHQVCESWSGRGEYDFVVFDERLPPEQGFASGTDLFMALRRGHWGDWGKDVPVAFLTNYGDQVEQNVEETSPAPVAVLKKPCTHPDSTRYLLLCFSDPACLANVQELVEHAKGRGSHLNGVEALPEDFQYASIEELNAKFADFRNWYGEQKPTDQHDLLQQAKGFDIPQELLFCLGIDGEGVQHDIDLGAFDASAYEALKSLQKILLEQGAPYDEEPFDRVRAIVASQGKPDSGIESAVLSFQRWWNSVEEHRLRKGFLQFAKDAALPDKAQKAMGL